MGNWSDFMSFFWKKNGEEEESSSSKSTELSVPEESSSGGYGSTAPRHQMTFGLATVFPYQELKEATNSFDSSRELGGGGYGKVYSGYLRGRMVAIKKLYDDPKVLEQFFNEVTVLSRIRHKNLVTLHGCSKPQSRKLLLVYELVPNGTVSDHLHGQRSVLTWATRVQIAVETAEALVYLHALEPPVIHRDVKTSNILLDNDFHVKVADLGICRLLPWDATQVFTKPQGTMGYRDPEYDRLCKLTLKSDVYSFGVVLLELISGKEAVDVNRASVYLDDMAVNIIISKKLKEFVDPKLGYQSDRDVTRMIDSVAELAQQCLLQEGNMRPHMVQILKVLKEIKDNTQHIYHDNKELEEVDNEARVFSHEEELRATNSLNPSQDPQHIKYETQRFEGKGKELEEVDIGAGFSEAYAFSHEELHVATNCFDSARDLQHGLGKVFHAIRARLHGFGPSGQPSNMDFHLVDLDLATIRAATGDFSNGNKLGEGGFGPVYKGTLSGGREIAVKRLSKKSSQGASEFKNEMKLIARLRNMNLVRVLGCCAEGEEQLLVYEYLPNKSLDAFLFDENRRSQLVWTTRRDIIRGIASGLSYIHEESPLSVIHVDLKVDLKAGNILLDNKMRPKISNFGIAKISETNVTDVNTGRVIGTLGYMAPESALDGFFSKKSDVYSFGVLLLEIISGQKNVSHFEQHGQTLMRHAWQLWTESRAMEMIENLLRDSYLQAEAMRVIHIGLLCVQNDEEERPTISSILIMLHNDIALPEPKQPPNSSLRRSLELESASSTTTASQSKGHSRASSSKGHSKN